MDPEPWELLHDGRVIGLTREGDTAEVTITAPHLRARLDGRHGPFTLRLLEVTRLVFVPYVVEGEAERIVEAPRGIVDERPDLVNASLEDGELVVWGSTGALRTIYGSMAIEVRTLGERVRRVETHLLRDAVKAFWDEWRSLQEPRARHPLIEVALSEGAWSAAAMVPLLEAWRSERTSDLADAIEILGEATEGEALPLPAHPEALASWQERFQSAPGTALSQLERCAIATFETLRGEEPADRRGLGAWLDARAAVNADWWRALTTAVAGLRSAPPDPRIGRTMTRMLASPSDDWFVAEHDGESFAGHALSLMEAHADAGTPARLRLEARDVAIEADCNGAEMVGELLRLADVVAEQHPRDRLLPGADERALERLLVR